MSVDVIEIANAGCTSEIQAWLTAHSTATIERIVVSGSYWYIFYTE